MVLVANYYPKSNLESMDVESRIKPSCYGSCYQLLHGY